MKRTEWPEWPAVLAVAAASSYWTLVRFPLPAWFLSDSGNGYQLGGASEVLAGRHPFIDFKDTYGPLVHYASAASLSLAGGRVGSEMLLATLALAVAYALMYWLLRRSAVPVGMALVATLAGAAMAPTTWRYYMVLLPLVFLAVMWRHLERPSAGRLALVGVVTAIAGLFRADLGAFTYVAGVMALLFRADGDARSGARAVAVYTGAVLATALPWLMWLMAHGRMVEYFIHSGIDPIRDAAAIARSAPPFDRALGWTARENLKAALFRMPTALLLLGVILVVLRRRALRSTDRARAWCLLTLTMMGQVSMGIVVDWIHLRDALAVRLVLLVWGLAAVAGASGEGWLARRWVHRWVMGIAIAIVGSLVVGAVSYERQRGAAPSGVVKKLESYACGRDEFLAQVRESGENFRAELCEYVRDHSRPDEAIFAVIEAAEINYFTNRRLAGPQLAIMPGYFASAAEQRELIAALRKAPLALLVVNRLDVGPEYPGVTLDKFAPEFYRFVETEFVEVWRVGYSRVLAPRWKRTGEGFTQNGSAAAWVR